jgi:hypothetical protein
MSQQVHSNSDICLSQQVHSNSDIYLSQQVYSNSDICLNRSIQTPISVCLNRSIHTPIFICLNRSIQTPTFMCLNRSIQTPTFVCLNRSIQTPTFTSMPREVSSASTPWTAMSVSPLPRVVWWFLRLPMLQYPLNRFVLLPPPNHYDLPQHRLPSWGRRNLQRICSQNWRQCLLPWCRQTIPIQESSCHPHCSGPCRVTLSVPIRQWCWGTWRNRTWRDISAWGWSTTGEHRRMPWAGFCLLKDLVMPQDSQNYIRFQAVTAVLLKSQVS